MIKADKIKNFDANGIGQLNDGMFGLPFSIDECETVLIPAELKDIVLKPNAKCQVLEIFVK